MKLCDLHRYVDARCRYHVERGDREVGLEERPLSNLVSLDGPGGNARRKREPALLCEVGATEDFAAERLDLLRIAAESLQPSSYCLHCRSGANAWFGLAVASYEGATR